MSKNTQGLGWAVQLPAMSSQELVNELDSLVHEALDRGREVAGVISRSDGTIVVFRPVFRGVSHVTATLVDSSGYRR